MISMQAITTIRYAEGQAVSPRSLPLGFGPHYLPFVRWTMPEDENSLGGWPVIFVLYPLGCILYE